MCHQRCGKTRYGRSLCNPYALSRVPYVRGRPSPQEKQRGPFCEFCKIHRCMTRVPHKVPVEFDSNFMIDENAISKVGRRVNVDKPHPPWCFAIQLYIVACSVLITHVAQPFVCGHQTIAHCIHLEPFACAIYGPSREPSTCCARPRPHRVDPAPRNASHHPG